MAYWKDWIIDSLHQIYGTTRYFHKGGPPQHYLDYVLTDKCPVIILSGLFGPWQDLKHLADEISLRGHPTYVIPKLGFNLQDIPTSAKTVRELIDENNINNCVIVAHSKGGLIGKYVLVHFNPDKRVCGMVSIATPYSGLEMADRFPIKSLLEVGMKSQIIADLKSHSEVNPQIISIAPLYDHLIPQEKGSFLEGAENITVDVIGHHTVIYRRETRDVIIQSIEKLSKKFSMGKHQD